MVLLRLTQRSRGLQAPSPGAGVKSGKEDPPHASPASPESPASLRSGLSVHTVPSTPSLDPRGFAGALRWPVLQTLTDSLLRPSSVQPRPRTPQPLWCPPEALCGPRRLCWACSQVPAWPLEVPCPDRAVTAGPACSCLHTPQYNKGFQLPPALSLLVSVLTREPHRRQGAIPTTHVPPGQLTVPHPTRCPGDRRWPPAPPQVSRPDGLNCGTHDRLAGLALRTLLGQ